MKKFGLIGNKISYSLSPRIHGVIYAELGIDARYDLFDIPQGGVGGRIDDLRALDGFNATQPHKLAVTEFLEENFSPVGAVNTVKVNGGKLYGYNTDVFGFKRDLEKNFGDLRGATALIAGAGGMAEAAAFVLSDMGADVYIKNRTAEKAEALCEKSGALLFAAGLKPDIAVNCSSAELFGGKVELDGADLSSLKFAYDTIYRETGFLSAAKALGAKTANGLNMLIYQAIKAVEIFTDTALSDGETERIKNKVKDGIEQ